MGDSSTTQQGIVARMGVVVASALLAFTLALPPAAPAWADPQPANDVSTVELFATAPEAQSDASDKAVSEDAEGEQIEDDETPMAEGLGGGEPVRAFVGNMHWILLAGIAVVVGLYATATNRLNRNINKMKHFMD